MAGFERSIRADVEQAPRGACSFWFWSIPLAWLTSALVLFAEQARVTGLHDWGSLLDAARLALLLAWSAVAWKCLAGATSPRLAARIASHVVVCLTVVGLPLHGYAAIAKDLRGPAHYHATVDASRHAHAERHFHAHGQSGIEVDDGERHHDSPAIEAGKSSSLGGFDALLPVHFQAIGQPCAGAIALDRFRNITSLSPSRLERPPESAAILQFR